MKFTQLKQHLLNEKLFPCYLVYGEDAGVRYFARRLFEKRITSFAELNVNYFEGKDDATSIVDVCQGFPFMSDYRLVYVRDFVSNAKQIEEYLKTPCPTTILVFESESVGNNLKKIMQTATVVDCSRLDEKFLSSYVASQVKKAGCQITVSATNLLIEYCNRYICKIDGEIAKLTSETDVIDEQFVREKVSPELEFAIYALSEVITLKDKEKTLSYLDKLMLDGNSPVAILGMLYNHFRKLFYVGINKTSDTLSADLNVKEYSLKFAFAQSEKYSPVTLKKICDVIGESDYAFKSGKMTDKNALYSCVLRILNI